MVSGFFTSPYDHERTRSGDARPMRIESKFSIGVCCLNSFSRSFMYCLLLLELHVDAEGADLLHQHVEGFRHTRLHLVVAIDNGLVHLRSTLHVVRLHREHFLQRVGSAVGFERPHFHLAETLSAELRLATERLLRDQAVRTGRPRM